MEKQSAKKCIKTLNEELNKTVDKYNEVYKDEKSTTNDVLEYGEKIINLQAKLINTLEKSASDMIKFLESLEQFEADMIMCEEAWDTCDGMPKLTKEFYDRWTELQSLRNKLLGYALGKAKTYEEIEKEANMQASFHNHP